MIPTGLPEAKPDLKRSLLPGVERDTYQWGLAEITIVARFIEKMGGASVSYEIS